MRFNDDEPIVATQENVSGRKPEPFLAGKTSTRIINKTVAPLEESELKVMLELTGAGSGKDRPGLDLVTVLDVSGSMKGDKLVKLKIAMQFLIKKLSPFDRLSVVKFSDCSTRVCPLRQMTEDAQTDIEDLVMDLNAEGRTNITAGLELGLKVLNDRKITSGRVVSIMLMSDGKQNTASGPDSGSDCGSVSGSDSGSDCGSDSGTDSGSNSDGTRDTDTGDAQYSIGDVPIYTFGFGKNYDPEMLNDIANNSKGGTFSDVQNQDNLSIAFSQCLAGLLTIVVEDLKLTVTQLESTIKTVSAGTYPQQKDDSSVTILLGDLYDKEVRKVTVDLLLPVVSLPADSRRRGSDVLEIKYTYRVVGREKPFEANPLVAAVSRVRNPVELENEEVMNEGNRLQTAQMMKEARIMADDNKLEEAKDKLVEAENLLEDVVDDESNPSNKMLKAELKQLLKLMKSSKIYEKQGRSFALSSEISHDRQRFASRGDVENLRLFATPRMDTYLEQAKSFDEDPDKPVPTVDEDVKQEIVADPLASIGGALSYYIQMAIQSLISIENILNNKSL